MEGEGKEEINFLKIPAKAIGGYVCPHLRWNDLLRFRRVCKWTGSIVYDFMRLHPEMAPEIEINEDNKTFGDFLKMDIPTTRIFLNNAAGEEFYRKAWKIGCIFLHEYGPLVKHLRVEELSPILFGKELTFLECLKNLETFELEYFGYGGDRLQIQAKESDARRRAQEDPRYLEGSSPIPGCFEQLEEIRIAKCRVHNTCELYNYTQDILKKCPRLEYMALPFSEYVSEHEGRLPTSLAYFFSCIRSAIEDKSVESHLKVVDFKSYHCVQEADDPLFWNCARPA